MQSIHVTAQYRRSKFRIYVVIVTRPDYVCVCVYVSRAYVSCIHASFWGILSPQTNGQNHFYAQCFYSTVLIVLIFKCDVPPIYGVVFAVYASVIHIIIFF